MNIRETSLDGVVIIKPDIFHDTRGFFSESYNERDFQRLGITARFIQDNHSFSHFAGTLRGLHYQSPPDAQAKLIRVISGAIVDVVVDIRRHSPTFGRWISVELTSINQLQLFIPQGFAHGYCTMTPDTHVLYKTDHYYAPSSDRGIRWDDPDLRIHWPTKHPLLSEKDQRQPRLYDAELGTYEEDKT